MEDVRRELTRQLPLPGRGKTLERWRMLSRIAGHDLCVAKIVEAHFDADAICADLDVPRPDVDELWAVWAAQVPGFQLEFNPGPSSGSSGRVSGTQQWCSGATVATHALVTASSGGERILVAVNLKQPGVDIDPSAWKAVGMGRIETSTVDFQDVPARRVGDTDAYLSRPGFWHGGAGIAACWHGASVEIAQALRTSPRVSKDPHAAVLLGRIDMHLAASAALLRALAMRIDDAPRQPHILAVQRVRSFAERTATKVLDGVGRALGAVPLCLDEAHAVRCADLTTFIRQSHADRDWSAMGQALAGEPDEWSL